MFCRVNYATHCKPVLTNDCLQSNFLITQFMICFCDVCKFYETMTCKSNCARLLRSIVQMSLRNDPSPRTIVDSLSSNIGKIAFDWQSGCIYWTDSLFNKIVMTPVSQSDFIKTVIILELDQPIGLALYPPNGTIFWSSTGTVDKIESMTMSGDYRTVLVAGTFNGGHPVSLTVDYTNFLYVDL